MSGSQENEVFHVHYYWHNNSSIVYSKSKKSLNLMRADLSNYCKDHRGDRFNEKRLADELVKGLADGTREHLAKDDQDIEFFSIRHEKQPNKPVADALRSPSPPKLCIYHTQKLRQAYMSKAAAEKVVIRDLAHDYSKIILAWQNGHKSLEQGDDFRSFINESDAIEHAKNELRKGQGDGREFKELRPTAWYVWAGVVLLDSEITPGEPSESCKVVEQVGVILKCGSSSGAGVQDPNL